jgi:hypothetical protein
MEDLLSLLSVSWVSAERAERTEGARWKAARMEWVIPGGFGAERGFV